MKQIALFSQLLIAPTSYAPPQINFTLILRQYTLPFDSKHHR